MSSLCWRSSSSRVISQVHFDQLCDSRLIVAVQSDQWPRAILVSTNQGGRGHGAAGLPASQLPSIRHAPDGRRWAAVTLDVSASRCVGESSTCREPQSSTENNRSGEHDFPGREHCCFLFDQSVVFVARCDGQNIVTQSSRWSRSSDWSVIPAGRS
jgi:hypothetical protein